MNPPIPTEPCFKCGEPTSATQSIGGVACYNCFNGVNMKSKPSKKPMPGKDGKGKKC
jgi:DNA-directed RNA polymerase subunit RPC12/RpoP